MAHNQITLLGRITKELVLKFSAGGMQYVNFTLAVQRNSTDCDFLPITAFKEVAISLCNYKKRGEQILVSGNLQSSSRDYNGSKRIFYNVIANKIDFISARKEPKLTQEPETPAPTPVSTKTDYREKMYPDSKTQQKQQIPSDLTSELPKNDLYDNTPAKKAKDYTNSDGIL